MKRIFALFIMLILIFNVLASCSHKESDVPEEDIEDIEVMEDDEQNIEETSGNEDDEGKEENKYPFSGKWMFLKAMDSITGSQTNVESMFYSENIIFNEDGTGEWYGLSGTWEIIDEDEEGITVACYNDSITGYVRYGYIKDLDIMCSVYSADDNVALYYARS
ncbi:MAG: hypothetical protein IJA55_09620 [Clostridia bacterium]|nr:hypothetical protein [Clostridia bacterium]